MNLKEKGDIIKEYYCSDDFNPILPLKPSFRHFRFKLSDGSWRKVKRKIRDVYDFKEALRKLGGVDLYYSTSSWLNPHKISAKSKSGSYRVADNLLLGADLVFDVDAETPITLESLDLARKSASNLYEGMKAFSDRFDFVDVQWTGGKGFRLFYEDRCFGDSIPSDPHKRIEHWTKNRKIFIDELLSYIKNKEFKSKFYKIRTFFDEEVSKNIMGVVRINGSVHGKTLMLCESIPVWLLRKPIKVILQKINSLSCERLGILEKGNDNGPPNQKDRVPRPRTIKREDDVASLASLPPTHKYFVSNKVFGVANLFVPVFKYFKGQKYKKELKRLKEEYNLGTLYFYEHNDEWVILSLKTMQRRQLQKMLNKTKSRTKFEFLNHNKILIPFTGKPFKKELGVVCGQISRPHFYYVEAGKEPSGNNRICGDKKLKIILGVRNGNRI